MKKFWAWFKRQFNVGYLVALAVSLLVGLLIGAGIIAITAVQAQQIAAAKA